MSMSRRRVWSSSQHSTSKAGPGVFRSGRRGSDEDIRLDRHADHLVELRGRFEPYSTATGFPSPLVGSVATREGGVEEREL